MRLFKKLIGLSLVLFCAVNQAQGQIDPNAFGYYQDVLRFSHFKQYGTARVFGIAGAGSTLGGDASATFLNPAGLGFFNRNQLVLTPNFTFSTYKTDFNGTQTEDEQNLTGFPNATAIINFNKSDLIPGGWRGATLGISYNRLADFKKTLNYSGYNGESSVIDAMIDNALGLTPSQLGGLEQAGYDLYLINPYPDDQTQYTSFVTGFPNQSERIVKSGHVDQFNIAVGANYEDKIYVGAGIAFTSSRYLYERVYTETFENSELNSFIIDERLSIQGNGVNANLGIILRPSQFFRIGASITTPTWNNFSEEGDVFYTADYNDYDVSQFLDQNGNRIIEEDTVLGRLQTNSPLFVSDYELRTPFKYNLGTSIVVGKAGFITADVEYMDYSNAKVSSNDFNESADNTTISNIYQNTLNARVGAELRLAVLRLRAGAAYLGNPYKESFDNRDRSQMIYSAGIGVYSRGFFADIGLSTMTTQDTFQSYSFYDGTGPVATTEAQNIQARLTLGINF